MRGALQDVRDQVTSSIQTVGDIVGKVTDTTRDADKNDGAAPPGTSQRDAA